MKRLLSWGGAILMACLVAWVAAEALAYRRRSEVVVLSGLNVEYLIAPDDARLLGGVFGDELAVTSAGVALFRSGNRLFQVKPGSRPFPLAVKDAAPMSFAVDSDDALLTISGGFFGMLDADGNTLESVPLPFDAMRLATSTRAGIVQLFGGQARDFRVYRFADDGRFQVLAALDEPIVAVADNAKAVYVATSREIFRFDAGGSKRLFTARTEDTDGGIISVAVLPSDDVVLFSTRLRVYGLRDQAAVSIVNNSGGALRLRGERLYVLDSSRRLLYAVSPIAQAFAEPPR